MPFLHGLISRLSNNFYITFPLFTAHHSTVKTIFPDDVFINSENPSYKRKRNEIFLFENSENVIIWYGWLEDRGNVKLLGKFLYLRKWGGSQHPSSDLVSELNNKVANLRNYRLIWLHRSCLQNKCHFCLPRPKSDHFLIDKKTLQHLYLVIRTIMTIMMMTMVIMVKLIMTMTMIFVVVNNVFRRCLLDGSGYSLMCCEGRQLYVA